jgi:hypothetical protein
MPGSVQRLGQQALYDRFRHSLTKGQQIVCTRSYYLLSVFGARCHGLPLPKQSALVVASAG